MPNPSNPQGSGPDALDGIPAELNLLLSLGGHNEAAREKLIELWNRIPQESEQDVVGITALQMQSVATMLRVEVLRFIENCGIAPEGVDVNEQFAAAILKTGLLVKQLEKDGTELRARLQEHQQGSKFVLWINLCFWLPLASTFNGWLIYQAFWPSVPPLMVPGVLSGLMLVSFFLTGMCVQQVIGYFSFRRLISPMTRFALPSERGSTGPVATAARK